LPSAPVTASIADRLSSTIFLAALAHGVVILGVTFATDPVPEPQDLRSLNVTLLVDAEAAETTHEADLLAARNAAGGGASDDSGRPTTMLSANHPLTQLGDPLGADLRDGRTVAAAPVPDQLVARTESLRRITAMPKATDEPSAVPMKAAALLEQTAPNTLAAEIDDQVQSQQSEDDSPLLSPSAQESAVAAYLVGWRQRVERIGTANFPRQFLVDSRTGINPVLEVAIKPDGQLDEIIVRRSSGNQSLDQAALRILRMAAPFEPLPDQLLADYDVLQFAYEWDFSSGSAESPGTLASRD
jgi:protein TonB